MSKTKAEGSHKENSIKNLANNATDSKAKAFSAGLLHLNKKTSETQQAFKQVQKLLDECGQSLQQHTGELNAIEKLKERCEKAEAELVEKDEKIKELEAATKCLSLMNAQTENDKQKEIQAIKDQQNELEAKLEETHKRKDQERRKLESQYVTEIAQLKRQNEDELDKKTKALNDGFDKKAVKDAALLSQLQQQNHKLRKLITKKETENGQLHEENTECRDNLADLKRSRKQLDQELRDKDQEMRKKIEQLGIKSQNIDIYKNGFEAIQHSIHGLASAYCRDFGALKNKIREDIHCKLYSADSSFEYVPISDSPESQQLCMAHFERVVSKALCDHVWKPLSTEMTANNPEIYKLLLELSSFVKETTSGSLAHMCWRIQTIRAFKYLPPDKMFIRTPPSSPTFSSPAQVKPVQATSTRADAVLKSVKTILDHLIEPSKLDSFKSDILYIVEQAIRIWNVADEDSLELKVSLKLDKDAFTEWRSEFYDPNSDESNKLEARDTVFALFPHVIARRIVDPYVEMPGTFPDDQKHIEMENIPVFSGVGLRKSSVLVTKAEQEFIDRRRRLEEAMEKASR